MERISFCASDSSSSISSSIGLHPVVSQRRLNRAIRSPIPASSCIVELWISRPRRLRSSAWPRITEFAEIFAETAKFEKLGHVVTCNRRKGPFADDKAIDANLEVVAPPALAAVVNDPERVGLARHDLVQAFDRVAGGRVAFG